MIWTRCREAVSGKTVTAFVCGGGDRNEVDRDRSDASMQSSTSFAPKRAVTLSEVPTLSVGTKSKGAPRKLRSVHSSTSFAPRRAVTLSEVPTLSVGTKSKGAPRKLRSVHSSTSLAPTRIVRAHYALTDSLG